MKTTILFISSSIHDLNIALSRCFNLKNQHLGFNVLFHFSYDTITRNSYRTTQKLLRMFIKVASRLNVRFKYGLTWNIYNMYDHKVCWPWKGPFLCVIDGSVVYGSCLALEHLSASKCRNWVDQPDEVIGFDCTVPGDYMSDSISLRLARSYSFDIYKATLSPRF